MKVNTRIEIPLKVIEKRVYNKIGMQTVIDICKGEVVSPEFCCVQRPAYF